MAKFASNYTFRTPLRTIEFRAGNETVDAEVIAAARAANVLEDEADGNDRPAKGGKTRRPINLEG